MTTEGPSELKRFVMIDRDGTIIKECQYLSDPDQVEIIPGAIESLLGFREMDLGLVVITNQSGLGRGLFGHEDLEQVHGRLVELLADEGILLDGLYFCPHSPDVECDCRKPRTGMVEQAAHDLNFLPEQGFVVGDRVADMRLGENVGATTFLVRTGYGRATEKEGRVEPGFVVDSIREAVPIIADLLVPMRS